MNHNFIKDRDIVMFSFQSWDTEIGSNFKDMAIELSKYNRVLFINRALDRKTKNKQKNDAKVIARIESIKHGIGELTEVMPNIWVHNPRTIVESINWIPIGFVHDYINKLNNEKIAIEINKQIALLNFKNILLLNDNDFIRGNHLREWIPCTEYIFYIRDYMLSVDFFKRHGKRLEASLMKKCDLVVANSSYLANYAKQFNPNSFDIGQGCDFKPYLIKEALAPKEFDEIKKPIIGYAGFISSIRLDETVLLHIAKSFPHYSLVLVGPVDETFENSELYNLSNVYMLGRKPPESLPQYIFHFDICINPQLINQVTIGNYPRKIDEYLAMGKPVVATYTAAMKMFEPYTFLCKTKDEYISQIEKIINTDDLNSDQQKLARQQFAVEHTWENSIGLLGDAYYAVIKNNTHA